MNKIDNEECVIIGNISNQKERKQEIDTTIISGIYKIINKVTNKYYVGSSKNILKRWICHKNKLNNNNHYNPYLQRAWNKYGEKKFEFAIIESTHPKVTLKKEQKYLNIAKKERNKTYNCRFISSGGGLDVEIIEKISNTLKEYYSKNKNPNLGKKHSLSTKLKMKENHADVGGCKNPRYDNKDYTFYNIKTKKTFYGKRNDFIKKYNLNAGHVCYVINKIKWFKSVKGWIVKY